MAKRYFEDEEQAKHYAKFRPSPPDALIEYVISKTKKNDLALDIGCGSGQMTKLLAPFFKKAETNTPFHLSRFFSIYKYIRYIFFVQSQHS